MMNPMEEIQDAHAQADDMHPFQQVCYTIDMLCVATLTDDNKGTMYTDITGRFSVMSFKRNQYLFVAYLYNRNAIIVCPMKSLKDEDMVAAFQDAIEYLNQESQSPCSTSWTMSA